MARQTDSSAANDKPTSRDAVRIPRLTYRNHIPQDGTDSIEPVSKRRSDSVTADKKPKKSKMRAISLLGFLAVKEPSANALDHFARQEQRRAEAKGSISIASMSHQKMPEGVPKVNTKWDGLPEAVKTRPGTSTDRQSTARSFSSSRLSTATEDSKRSKSTTSTTSTIDFALETPSVEELSPRPGKLSSTRQDSGTGSEAMRSRTGGLTSGAVRSAQPRPNISEVAPWAEPPL
ncbi:hypothetical protein IWZ03DRAFT_357557 [Phyllosticta citriasiana]|uniref:Uncharacterized protein n=1 Tax=Phyllosticta citriasiana TaxID=595635 RepID=A0ABR1KWG8_9PEZI